MPKKKTSKSRHHRLAKANGGTANFPQNNISLVTKVQHRAFNILFGGDATVWQVARRLSQIWVDPRYEIIVIKRRSHEKKRGHGEQVLCGGLQEDPRVSRLTSDS